MTDDLVSWLRTQLDEDEREARGYLNGGSLEEREHSMPEWRLADIAAKRAILDLLAITEERTMPTESWIVAKQVLRLLASAYSTRPGYREEWRP